MRGTTAKKTEDILPYNRLLDIASRALQDLVDAEPLEAETYFNNALELTAEERIALGLDDMKIFK